MAENSGAIGTRVCNIFSGVDTTRYPRTGPEEQTNNESGNERTCSSHVLCRRQHALLASRTNNILRHFTESDRSLSHHATRLYYYGRCRLTNILGLLVQWLLGWWYIGGWLVLGRGINFSLVCSSWLPYLLVRWRFFWIFHVSVSCLV